MYAVAGLACAAAAIVTGLQERPAGGVRSSAPPTPQVSQQPSGIEQVIGDVADTLRPRAMLRPQKSATEARETRPESSLQPLIARSSPPAVASPRVEPASARP